MWEGRTVSLLAAPHPLASVRLGTTVFQVGWPYHNFTGLSPPVVFLNGIHRSRLVFLER